MDETRPTATTAEEGRTGRLARRDTGSDRRRRRPRRKKASDDSGLRSPAGSGRSGRAWVAGPLSMVDDSSDSLEPHSPASSRRSSGSGVRPPRSREPSSLAAARAELKREAASRGSSSSSRSDSKRAATADGLPAALAVGGGALMMGLKRDTRWNPMTMRFTNAQLEKELRDRWQLSGGTLLQGFVSLMFWVVALAMMYMDDLVEGSLLFVVIILFGSIVGVIPLFRPPTQHGRALRIVSALGVSVTAISSGLRTIYLPSSTYLQGGRLLFGIYVFSALFSCLALRLMVVEAMLVMPLLSIYYIVVSSLVLPHSILVNILTGTLVAYVMLLLCRIHERLYRALFLSRRKVELTERRLQLQIEEMWPDAMSVAAAADGRPVIRREWRIDPAEVSIVERVGAGSFGEVFKGEWHGKEVAIKKLYKSLFRSSKGRMAREFAKEVEMLGKLRHPNVMLFMGASIAVPNLMIVTEYADRGSLWDVLHDDSVRLDWRLRKNMALDACLGMNHLHMSHMVHGDLKSPNLLVTTNYNVKVSDFGMARWLRGSRRSKSRARDARVLTSPLWSAPELISSGRPTKQSDVYSFGICLWEIMTRDVPYEDADAAMISLNVVTKNYRPDEGRSMADAPLPWVALMRACWQADPKQRPTFNEVLNELRLMKMPKRSRGPRRAPTSEEKSSLDDSHSWLEPSDYLRPSSPSSDHSSLLSASLTVATAATAGTETSVFDVPLHWHLDSSELKLLEVIGIGSSGQVYRGEYRDQCVAVKSLCTEGDMRSRTFPSTEAELRIIMALSHPNIVRLIGIVYVEPVTCMVVEFMERGSLTDIIHDHRVSMGWRERVDFARDAARGMHYLHTYKPVIMHRDLKSLNLLVDATGMVKVSDFGFSRFKKSNVTMTRCGTPAWVAPEVLRGESYNEKIDIYSFGIVMWELLTRDEPYRDETDLILLMSRITHEQLRPPLPETLSVDALGITIASSYVLLMQRCWAADPAARPTFEDILESLQVIHDSIAGAVRPPTPPPNVMLPPPLSPVPVPDDDGALDDYVDDDDLLPHDGHAAVLHGEHGGVADDAHDDAHRRLHARIHSVGMGDDAAFLAGDEGGEGDEGDGDDLPLSLDSSRLAREIMDETGVRLPHSVPSPRTPPQPTVAAVPPREPSPTFAPRGLHSGSVAPLDGGRAVRLPPQAFGLPALPAGAVATVGDCPPPAALTLRDLHSPTHVESVEKVAIPIAGRPAPCLAPRTSGDSSTGTPARLSSHDDDLADGVGRPPSDSVDEFLRYLDEPRGVEPV